MSEILPNKDFADSGSEPIYRRELVADFSVPMVMFVLALIPGLDFFMYTGHGGIAWMVIPLCFPFVIVRAVIKLVKSSGATRKWYKRFFLITIPSYIAVALPLSWAATKSIRASFGFEVPTWAFFAIMVSPFPWWYFT